MMMYNGLLHNPDQMKISKDINTIIPQHPPSNINICHGHKPDLPITSLRTPSPQISCLALTTTSLYAASLNHISVFDLTNLALIHSFQLPPASGLVKSITFTNNKIFTAHQDRKIRVWQLLSSKRHRLVSTLPTVKDHLYRCISPHNYVQVRRHKKQLWIQHADAVSGLAANLNHGLMYSVSWDTSFKIWRLSDLRCLQSVKAHADAVNDVVCSVSGTVYTASADGKIKIWDTSKNSSTSSGNKSFKYGLVSTLEKHNSSVNALALSDDGVSLFSGGYDRLIFVWEKDDNSSNDEQHQMVVKFSLGGHTNAVMCLIYVNELLISGSSDRTVRIWGFGSEAYCCLAVFEGHSKPIKSLAAVSNCEQSESDGAVSIYSGSLDGEIKVWQFNH